MFLAQSYSGMYNQQQVHDIFNSIPTAFYALDNEFRFVFINDQFESLVRRGKQELLGKHLLSVFPGENGQPFVKKLEQVAKTGEVDSFEQYYQPANLWFRIDAYPSKAGIAVYVTDITRQKHLEQTVESTRQSLTHFMDYAPAGIHLADEGGRAIYANKEKLQLMGYTKEEFVGTSLTHCYIDQEAIDFIMKHHLKHENIDNFEARIRRKDGEIRHVILSSSVYRNHGDYVYTTYFTRDITNRVRTENRLKFLNYASQELTATLDTQVALKKISDLIIPEYADWFSIDRLTLDQQVENILVAHIDPEKIKWALAFREIDPVDFDRPQSLGWVLKTGTNVLIPRIDDEMIAAAARNPEHLALLEKLHLRSAITVPMSTKGRIIGAVTFISTKEGSYYDEDDLKFAENFANRIALTLENARLYEAAQEEIEQRRQAEQKKDEFISMASHELKTPLTSLKAYLQLLERVGFGSKEVAENYLQKASKGIEKLEVLIGDLLDVSKIEAGKLHVEMGDLNLGEVIESSVEHAMMFSQKHEIIVKGNANVIIYGNKERLDQVLLNLLSNAIKYSPEANKVEITTSVKEQEVEVAVSDWGIGIPEEKHSRIFEKFFRVEDHSFQFSGLGIGLYISSEIIRRHGGRIGVKKNKEGSGSTFYFVLPIPRETVH